MRNNFKLLVILFIIFMCGCQNKNYIECNIDLNNNVDNYKLTGAYKIFYDDIYVTKIEKEEIYQSDSSEVLNYFEDYKKIDTNYLNDIYGGYSLNLEKEENKIKVKTEINMSEVNINRMLKNGYIDKDYTISNKLTVSGLKKIYKSKGVKCYER